MSLPVDSGGGSTFETLPLTPPRPSNKYDEASSASPRFANNLPRLHTERSFSFSQGQAHTTPPSPLGAGTPYPHSSGPIGESRFSRLATSPSPLVTAERDYRAGGLSQSSSLNYAVENQTQSWIMASPRANDKPPIPIFSRVGSLKKSASFNRSLSQKEASAPHTLNRLLSMEKGENFRWSPYDEGNRNDFSFTRVGTGAELDDEVLESKSQDEGSLSLWKTWKHGSPASKKLMVVIALTFAYSAIEFLIGLFTGRIGLVSDSFHLTFGCGVLTFSLFAMISSKSRPNDKYTYGYNRLEVLAAFTNALFLLFLSFSLAVEALHAFVQDEEEHKHYLIISAVANLTVNLLGVWFFRSYARVRVVYRKAEDMNNQSICLHVLSDSIRSAGVVLASWLLALGVRYAETLCLGLVAVAIFMTTIPLFKASGGVLLQMAPPGISKSAFSKCQRQITLLEEVIDCYKARFWDIVPGSVVGTLVLQIKAGSDEQKILKHVHSIYNDIGVKDLTVQLEYQQKSACC
ncbi:unnamed protein product [Calypogeia fissa]